MDGGFTAQDHDRTGTPGQGIQRRVCHSLEVQWNTGPYIPTRSASDAKITTQIAATQGQGKRGNQRQFLSDIHLRRKKASFGASVTQALFPNSAVNAAMMRAQVTVGQHGPGFAGSVGSDAWPGWV